MSSRKTETSEWALLNYFRLRKLWENRQLDQLSGDDFAVLNHGEKKLATPDHLSTINPVPGKPALP
jgi:hypothetical protein